MRKIKIKPIKVMDQNLIAQIAAGEVIERPASAMKELMENAIDAKATEIHVDITRGGLTEIKVKDNGVGIPENELALAVRPHATSKLSRVEDLENIQTLGFRGEALASIASLSNLTIKSRVQREPEGAEMKLRGSQIQTEPQPYLMPPGTEITVNDLFIHAPARRSFISRDKLEYSYCDSVWRSLVVLNPQIAFTFSHAGKIKHNFPPQSLQERVFEALGKVFAANAVQIKHRKGPLKLHGWIRPNGSTDRHRQFIVLNNRSLSDRFLRQAIRKACADIMRRDSVPYALFIDAPFDLVDVNSHPAKLEVRFKEKQAMFKFVYDAVRKVTTLPIYHGHEEVIIPGKGTLKLESGMAERQASNLIMKLLENEEKNAPKEDPKPVQTIKETGSEKQDEKEGLDLGDAIGVLHGLYLIAQNSKGLVFVDLHAAHERLIYEDLKKLLNAGRIEKRQFLEPLELELSAEQIDALLEEREHLDKFGFAISTEGGAHFLQSVPNAFVDKMLEPDRLVLEYLSEVANLGVGTSVETERNRILSSVACHSAMRGSQDHIPLSELNFFLRKMERTPSAGVCNHGRPTWKMMKIDDLDNHFERGK